MDGAEEPVVVELRVKLEEIVERAYEAEDVEELETQSPEDLGVGVGRMCDGGEPLGLDSNAVGRIIPFG